MTRKLQIAYQRYTSCGGCQLTLLNCERELSHLYRGCDFVEFPLISSDNDLSSSVDVALAEGSISSLEELKRLLALRYRAATLIAVGACALHGGVNLLARGGETISAATGDVSDRSPVSFKPLPLHHFVKIDAAIYGCPPEGADYLRMFGALQYGGYPYESAVPVCMECRLRENLCLLLEGNLPCLGPVTRGGCLARCPSCSAVCEGCRGAVPEANFAEENRLLRKAGFTEAEIGRLLERFLWRGDEGH